ncbi:MAG: hypothetical protein LC624_09740, partial [Halobacteriales archaeon]|nr:hypothetical protein [Halobacteriales archaeon]
MSPPPAELERPPEEFPPEAQPTLEEQRILQHLLFHKSLLSEDGDGARINNYLAMVKASKEGAHLVMVNPFDKAIAIAFQLVMEKHLDPWRLDLVQFTEMYLKHVRKGGEVDLITAGRLIFMAWTVLKLQSDEALLHAEQSRNLPQPEPEVSWDDIPADGWLTDDGEYAFTNAVLAN